MELNSSNSRGNVCNHLPFTVNMVPYVHNEGPLQTVTIVTCAFNSLSCLFTLMGNILVFIGVLTKHDLRTVHYTSILFLAATDLLVGSVAQPAFVFFQISKLVTGSGFSCVALAIYTSTVFLCTGLSILTLIVITLERYFAIFYPFKYQNLVTKRRMIGTILLVWLIWTTFITIVRFSTRITTSNLGTIASVLIVTCLVITLFVYLWVQKLVLRNLRAVVPGPVLSGITSGNRNEVLQHRNVSATKSSSTVAILTGTLALCLLPTIVASVVVQTKATNEETLYHLIYPLTDTAVILNSTLNPFIYVIRSDIVRRSIRNFIQRWIY